jgi:hypothetical protein
MNDGIAGMPGNLLSPGAEQGLQERQRRNRRRVKSPQARQTICPKFMAVLARGTEIRYAQRGDKTVLFPGYLFSKAFRSRGY